MRAGRGGLLGSRVETHLDGKIMDSHRRTRRTLGNIVAETGASNLADVSAPGLAALSAVWRVLLGFNFHSSHWPRPALPSLAPPPWTPLENSDDLFAAVARVGGGGKGT